MTTITKIHGFRRREAAAGLESTSHARAEVLLVEATTPLVTWAELVEYLPSFSSGPGSLEENPFQITLTLNQSRHPEDSYFRLISYGPGKRASSEGGGGKDRFWEIPLRYSTELPARGGSELELSQRIQNPDDEDEDDQDPIIDPTTRPPIWTGSSKIVMRKSFFDMEGNRIVHTNRLPVTSPVSIPYALLEWRWSLNVDAKTYDNEDFDNPDTGIFNRMNATAFTIPMGTDLSYNVAANQMKCVGISANEVYETPANTTTQYHYVRISCTFHTLTNSEDTWDNPPLSLHTHQRSNISKPIRIQINDRGDLAEEPWPLNALGFAIDYDDLNSTPQEDYGVLQSNDGGTLSNLVVCEEADFAFFFNKYSLTLPKKMGN
jgi:hypothetical protein